MQSPMISIGRSKYYSEIPANFMIKDSMEYYLVLGTLNGDVYTFPEFQAKENPISIKVLDTLDKRIPINPRDKKNFEIIGLDPNVVIISPDPGSDIRSRDCLIALSYLYEDNIDINKIKVFLDGTDVTNEAKIDSSYISLLKKNITPGLHKVIINLTNKYNQKFNDIVWDFTVLPNNVNNYGLIKKQQGDIVANYQKGNISGSKMGSTNLIFDYDIEFDWLQCDIKYNKSSLENDLDEIIRTDSFFTRNTGACHKQITKKYTSISQLQSDNEQKIRWDPEYDDTPVHWIEEVKTAEGDDSQKFAQKTLLKMVEEREPHIFISKQQQKHIVDDILRGGKLVKIGDFAILQTSEYESNQLWKRILTGNKEEIWTLHGEQDIDTTEQLCLQNGKDITNLSFSKIKDPDCLPSGNNTIPCLPKKVDRIKKDIEYTTNLINRLEEELSSHSSGKNIIETIQLEKYYYQKKLRQKNNYQKYCDQKLLQEKEDRIKTIPTLSQSKINKKIQRILSIPNIDNYPFFSKYLILQKYF